MSYLREREIENAEAQLKTVQAHIRQMLRTNRRLEVDEINKDLMILRGQVGDVERLVNDIEHSVPFSVMSLRELVVSLKDQLADLRREKRLQSRAQGD